jgi:hypothetical protein
MDVEEVGTAQDLVHESSALIPDPQHAIADLHLQAILVQPPEAQDGALERWDVEDTVQHLLLAVLALERNGADALDGHLGRIA